MFLGINLHWATEMDWRFFWIGMVPASLGLLALAYAQMARIALDAPRSLRAAAPESLVAVLLALGTVSYLQTPVPYKQSLLFSSRPGWQSWRPALSFATPKTRRR